MNAEAIAIQFADALCRERPLTKTETDRLCEVMRSQTGTKRTIWTQADDRTLRRLLGKRMTAEKIAEKMGRTLHSIQARKKRLKGMDRA
jgi:hypothetical protein